MKKVKFHTLGCKVNLYETECMKALFLQHGYTVTEQDDADVFVINTCTVTAAGDKKSRQMIRRAKRSNPDSIVVVTGCYAQVSPEEVRSIPGVNLVLGTTDRGKIVELTESFCGTQISCVKSHIPAVFEDLAATHQSRTRATIKIQDGCRNFCAYCIIPYARGPIRSKPLQSLLDEVRALAANGYRELVLTGINLAAYGSDIGLTLADALGAVCGAGGIERVRLGSLEPVLITDEFLSRIKGYSNLCPHFHLSLQSGCSETLKRMNRRYTAGEYLTAVRKLQDAFADCAVTTDVMVGFPGETEAEFQESCETVRRAGFSAIHVFPYSRRKGTAADRMPDQIDEAVKARRAGEMLELGRMMQHAYFEKYLGRTMPVLFEQACAPGLFEGHTPNYLRVIAKGAALEGQTLPVRLTEIRRDAMYGVLGGIDA